MRIIRRKSSDPLKGMIAGAAGGLVASWVMNQFQAIASHLVYGLTTEIVRREVRRALD